MREKGVTVIDADERRLASLAAQGRQKKTCTTMILRKNGKETKCGKVVRYKRIWANHVIEMCGKCTEQWDTVVTEALLQTRPKRETTYGRAKHNAENRRYRKKKKEREVLNNTVQIKGTTKKVPRGSKAKALSS